MESVKLGQGGVRKKIVGPDTPESTVAPTRKIAVSYSKLCAAETHMSRLIDTLRKSVGDSPAKRRRVGDKGPVDDRDPPSTSGTGMVTLESTYRYTMDEIRTRESELRR